LYLPLPTFELQHVQIESDAHMWWKEDDRETDEVVARGIKFMKWYLLVHTSFRNMLYYMH